MLAAHPQPSGYKAALHGGDGGIGRGHQLGRTAGADAYQEPALRARSNSHVATDEKR